jgi:FkbM family methyltransferase
MNKLIKKMLYMCAPDSLLSKKKSDYKKWLLSNGEQTLRLNYDLKKDSIVFDIGGYKGNFADDIYNKYMCTVYIFEPVNYFYDHIKNRFVGNEKIKAYKYGLSNCEKTIEISIENDSSSVHKRSNNIETIKLINVTNFIRNNSIKKIDLLKINIEGGEYEVIPELINSGDIDKIMNLQIQFHDFIDDCDTKRDEIRNELNKTHELTYDYYYIWENWKLKTTYKLN